VNVNKTIKTIIINYKFILFFALSYIAIVLFFHRAYFIGPVDIPVDGTVIMGRSEPIYHFLSRYFGAIDGGEFKGYDTKLSRIDFWGLVEAFFYLYLIEWIAYRFYWLVRRYKAK
jgi:hypothetical protein